MRNVEMNPVTLPFLSHTAEHALRAVVYLARREPSELVPATEIATALGSPPNYLGKTLQRLARRGLLRSARGPRGGFALATDPGEISAASVLAAVDEARSAPACLAGDRPCDPRRPCAVHPRWSAMAERVVEPLRTTTIADLAGDTGPLPTRGAATTAPR